MERSIDDAVWAVLVPALVLLTMRLIDATLPKGHTFRFTRRWLVKVEEDHDPKEDDDEPEHD